MLKNEMMNNEKELNIAEKVSLGVACCCRILLTILFYSVSGGEKRRVEWYCIVTVRRKEGEHGNRMAS